MREVRFEAMFDVLAATLPKRFHALDLGSGPGSLSARLLRRFPRATVVAVDRDPVTLRIGEVALGSLGGRLSWCDADLASGGWSRRLPLRRYDAALSTTALHWLEPDRLRALYRELRGRLRPKGVLLNGDFVPWPEREPRMTRLADRVRRVRYRGNFAAVMRTEWRDWWRRAEATPGLAAEFVEHRRRFPTGHPHGRVGSVDVHLRALRDAGFRDATVVWQDFENRVVLGRR